MSRKLYERRKHSLDIGSMGLLVLIIVIAMLFFVNIIDDLLGNVSPTQTTHEDIEATSYDFPDYWPGKGEALSNETLYA